MIVRSMFLLLWCISSTIGANVSSKYLMPVHTMHFIFGLFGTLATIIGEATQNFCKQRCLVALVAVAVSAIMGTFAGRRL